MEEEIKKIVEGHALALSTVDETGNPHCIAVGDVKVVEEDKLLIGDVFLVQTVKNLEKNNNVSLAVWNKNWEEDCKGYELKGTAERFTEGKWVDMAKEIHEDLTVKAAILITLNEVRKLRT